MAISLFSSPQNRTIFRTEVNNIFTTQIVNLPLKELFKHQRSDASIKDGTPTFKSLPPGYKTRISLH